MQIDVRFVDVTEYLGGEPTYVALNRGASDVWRTSKRPLQSGQPPEWVTTSKNEQVLIPLWAYRVPDDMGAVLAFGLQLGFVCRDEAQLTPRLLQLVIGRPTYAQQDEQGVVSHQCQIGIALKL